MSLGGVKFWCTSNVVKNISYASKDFLKNRQQIHVPNHQFWTGKLGMRMVGCPWNHENVLAHAHAMHALKYKWKVWLEKQHKNLHAPKSFFSLKNSSSVNFQSDSQISSLARGYFTLLFCTSTPIYNLMTTKCLGGTIKPSFRTTFSNSSPVHKKNWADIWSTIKKYWILGSYYPS